MSVSKVRIAILSLLFLSNVDTEKISKFRLYGLERSGTNVVTHYLQDNFGITIIRDGPTRKDAKHKHFRIYDAKKFIRARGQRNETFVGSVDHLDSLTGDDSHTQKYFVVYKNIWAWLPSIMRVSWYFDDIPNKYNHIDPLIHIDDYINFIQKWQQIKNERVLFINYDDFIDNYTNADSSFYKNIAHFIGNDKTISSRGKAITRKKVPMSPNFIQKRLNYYKNKEYMDYFSNKQKDIIIKKMKSYNFKL